MFVNLNLKKIVIWKLVNWVQESMGVINNLLMIFFWKLTLRGQNHKILNKNSILKKKKIIKINR